MTHTKEIQLYNLVINYSTVQALQYNSTNKYRKVWYNAVYVRSTVGKTKYSTVQVQSIQLTL